jgi:hypothetical protein
MLLTGFCGLLSALFQAAAYYQPAVSLSAFPPLFTECSCGDQVLALPLFCGALTAPCTLCCVLVFISLFIVQGFFALEGVSLPRGYAGLF